VEPKKVSEIAVGREVVQAAPRAAAPATLPRR